MRDHVMRFYRWAMLIGVWLVVAGVGWSMARTLGKPSGLAVGLWALGLWGVGGWAAWRWWRWADREGGFR